MTRVLFWGYIAKLVQVIFCTDFACMLPYFWVWRHEKCPFKHQIKHTHHKYSKYVKLAL